MNKIASPVAEKIGSYWSSVAENSTELKLRWWQSPFVINHINNKISRSESNEIHSGIAQRALEIAGSRLPFLRGISIGCGNGQKEMELIRQGVVSHFDLYEYSNIFIEQGKQLAKNLGVEGKVNFYQSDAVELIEENESFDFVHWNNSLHHMFDVEASIKWSYKILTVGGMFYMDDYVGPSRFQWSDKMLEIASKIRGALPEKYLVNPLDPRFLLSKNINRPKVEDMIKLDPSEAADSERILKFVKKFFPGAEVTITGGAVYHLTLNDILHNFDESQDRHILDLLMIIDDLCSEIGEYHYATALAIK